NIVKWKFAYSTETSPEQLESVYLATEIAGCDLRTLLSEETRKSQQIFSLIDFKRMISDLLRALKYLNSAKVIHRDLKPDNFAINSGRKLTLLDFGIARVINFDKMTREPGMKFYRAFETYAFGPENDIDPVVVYNEKADMWSIGAILYEMLTGDILFEAEHPLLKAIEICGKIPDAMLDKIKHESSREYLRKESENAKRIDFIKRLATEGRGRSWLKEEIKANAKDLANFFDRTLVFDPGDRLTVDEALQHTFLHEVRHFDREVPATHSIFDVPDSTLEEWKQLIWRAIHDNPISIDTVPIR
ncbi:hypothetical protein PFISCL1PPCAC_16951, partial [Pristionchus fissidentatus]